MKKTTADAAQASDSSKKAPSETGQHGRTSEQNRRNSSAVSKGGQIRTSSSDREIDLIPLPSRRDSNISRQNRQRHTASSGDSVRASSGDSVRTSAGDSVRASADRRQRRRTASSAGQRRNAGPAQRQNRKAAAGKRRNKSVAAQLPRPAVIIIIVLFSILLGSGILQLTGFGKDKIPPVITLNHREGYVLMPWQEYEEEGFSASDDRDGDLTDQVERTVLEDRIGYKVSDSAGNVSVLYRDIPYDTSYKEATGEDFPDLDIDDSHAEGKIVYLTFDDGPGAYTEELLETLERYGVNVTFFVTGAFPQYEDMIKKEDAAGHSVGVHTFSHDFAKIYDDDKAFWKDIDKIEDAVQRQTGHRTNLMRFAGGSSNTICSWDLMSELTKQAAEKGFQYFDWNISSGDGGSEGDMKMVLKQVTAGLPKQDTCVVLCHDTKEYTVKAMKYLIPWLLDHGYDIRPLQIDSEPAHHWVED